jgi:hypothetical protein
MKNSKKGFITTLIDRVPSELAQTLRANGYKGAINDRMDLGNIAMRWINNQEVKAVPCLAKIHPDRDIILKAEEMTKAPEKKELSDDKSCTGCEAAAAALLLADGTQSATPTRISINPNLLIMLGAGILTVAIVATVISK